MYKKLEKLLESRNITPYRLAKDTGVPAPALSLWKNGKAIPKTDKIQKIADYFNVPLSYFYTDDVDGYEDANIIQREQDIQNAIEEFKSSLPSDQALKIAEEFDKLTEAQQQAVRQIIKSCLKLQ